MASQIVSTQDVDLLILNGTVIDGTGGPACLCDVGVRDGKIVGVSKSFFKSATARTIIDARGKYVVPGFIDVHTHVEANIPSSSPFSPRNFLRQGITTLITGNCGRSTLDVAGLFSALEKNGTAINFATLIGLNSVREEVMGEKAREPSEIEMAKMRQIVDRAMRDGAVGFSTGFVYVPGRFAKIQEAVDLVTVAAQYGGIYTSHI